MPAAREGAAPVAQHERAARQLHGREAAIRLAHEVGDADARSAAGEGRDCPRPAHGKTRPMRHRVSAETPVPFSSVAAMTPSAAKGSWSTCTVTW